MILKAVVLCPKCMSDNYDCVIGKEENPLTQQDCVVVDGICPDCQYVIKLYCSTWQEAIEVTEDMEKKMYETFDKTFSLN